jgi:hypothetical protein
MPNRPDITKYGTIALAFVRFMLHISYQLSQLRFCKICLVNIIFRNKTYYELGIKKNRIYIGIIIFIGQKRLGIFFVITKM